MGGELGVERRCYLAASFDEHVGENWRTGGESRGKGEENEFSEKKERGVMGSERIGKEGRTHVALPS